MRDGHTFRCCDHEVEKYVRAAKRAKLDIVKIKEGSGFLFKPIIAK